MSARPYLLALFLCFCAIAPFAACAQSSSLTPSPANFIHGSETKLSRQIAALLAQEPASRAHWGISVTQLDGTVVYSLDASRFFRPASTAKLFTTAAAMALLGPDHRFSTRLMGDLDPATGIVRGDLTLMGGGDPGLGTHDLPYQRAQPFAGSAATLASTFRNLAEQLTRAGVHQVVGDLVGDDSLFEATAVPEGWAAEDLLWGYGALPSALSVADNELVLTIQPPAAGAQSAPALVTIDQLVPWLQVTNDVSVQSADPNQPSPVGAQPMAGTPRNLRLYGGVAPGAAALHEHFALADPAGYATEALRTTLAGSGVLLTSGTRTSHAPLPGQVPPFLKGLRQPLCARTPTDPASCRPSCPGDAASTHVLAELLSPPLADDIAFTLKTSANLHAELLLHHLGLQLVCSGSTTLDGARVLRAWLQGAGVQPDDVFLYDGSGLSTKDLVTPRAETQLLSFAAAQPWFARWLPALPVGGVDGTLATRFTTAPLKNHVFAKTGTLGETRALAGFVDCNSGRRLAFAIMVDNHQPGTAADLATMDNIVALIAATN